MFFAFGSMLMQSFILDVRHRNTVWLKYLHGNTIFLFHLYYYDGKFLDIAWWYHGCECGNIVAWFLFQTYIMTLVIVIQTIVMTLYLGVLYHHGFRYDCIWTFTIEMSCFGGKNVKVSWTIIMQYNILYVILF